MKCRFLFAFLLFGSLARAEGPAVTVVTGPEPDALEQIAAKELETTLVALFDAKVTLTKTATDAPNRILLGNPATHPTLAKALGAAWATGADGQTHLVKSTPQGLVLAGGSPQATLWAVAEYGHLNGVRVLPDAEYLPVEKPPFTLDGFDVVLQPSQEIRAWRTLGTSPASQAAWGLEDLESSFRRLALMKFNRVVFAVKPSQVFAGTVSEGSGIWAGEVIDVTGDLAGRSVFKGAKAFDHPALAGSATPAARREAALAFVKAALLSAEKAGLATQIELESDREEDFERIADLYPEAGSVAGMAGEPVLEAGWLGGYFPYPEILESAKGNRRGFQLHARFAGDQNATIWKLARESSGSALDSDQALAQLLLPICGEGVADPFGNGIAALTKAGRLMFDEDPTFVSSGFMRFYESSDSVPEWWSQAKDLYGKAVGEFYRANTRARDGARPLILRYAKRATFALHYVTAAEAARNASIAKGAGDDNARIEQLELAIEAMHNALAIYAEVATEAGDAGAIALMNQEAYTPLLEALDE